MGEFLHAIAPQLAALLRAAADYLESESSEDEFDEYDGPTRSAVHLDERGQVVRV